MAEWLELAAEAWAHRSAAASIDLIMLGPDGENTVLHIHDKKVFRGQVPHALDFAILDLTHPAFGWDAEPRRSQAIQLSGPTAAQALAQILAGVRGGMIGSGVR
jgi:hypothetical protein